MAPGRSLLANFFVNIFILVKAILTLIFNLCVPWKTARDIIGFIVGFPFYYFWITVDRKLFPPGKRFNPFIQFPRDTNEVLQRKELLFELIISSLKNQRKTGHVRDYSKVGEWSSTEDQTKNFSPLRAPSSIPLNAKFVNLTRSGETDSFIQESLKTIQVSFFDLTFKVPSCCGGEDEIRKVTLFIKIPLGTRTIPMSVTTLGAVGMERNMEQRFCEDAFPFINPEEVNVPHVYACFGSRLYQHLCIVAEKVDTSVWKSTTDAVGMSMGQAQALVKASARLHAQAWNPSPSSSDPRFNHGWDARKGLEWIGGIMPLCFSDKPEDRYRSPAWVPSLWWTLVEFFANSTMCLSHADCRSGNMLFSKKRCPTSKQSMPIVTGGANQRRGETTKTAADNEQEEVDESVEIIMTDWEGCQITPASWDITYSIVSGLPPYERRLKQRYLFELHWLALVECLSKKSSMEAMTLFAPLDEKQFPHEVKQQQSSSSPYKMDVLKDRLELEVDVMPLVMFYFAWLISQTGNAGETQGNNTSDGKTWGDRLRGAILDSLLEQKQPAGEKDVDVDKYSTWTAPHFSHKPDLNSDFTTTPTSETMEDLGLISGKLGNTKPTPSVDDNNLEPSHANRTRVSEDGGAILSTVEPNYKDMVLSGRILHFLEPYHKQARDSINNKKCKIKQGSPASSRTLKQDLLEMIQYVSTKEFEKDVEFGQIKDWKMDFSSSESNGGKPLGMKKND